MARRTKFVAFPGIADFDISMTTSSTFWQILRSSGAKPGLARNSVLYPSINVFSSVRAVCKFIWGNVITDTRGSFSPGSEKPTELLDGITREIAAMIDNPEVELSKVMREKAEESVLRAYLDGLNFLLNGKRG